MLFVVILAANGFFLLSWARQVLPLVIEVLRRKFSRFSKNYRINPIVRKPMKSSEYQGSMDFSGDSKGTRVQPEFDHSDMSISAGQVTPMSGYPPDNTPCSIEQSQADQPGGSVDWS